MGLQTPVYLDRLFNRYHNLALVSLGTVKRVKLRSVAQDIELDPPFFQTLPSFDPYDAIYMIILSN